VFVDAVSKKKKVWKGVGMRRRTLIRRGRRGLL
jgi:hypothetical protein